MPRWSPFAFSLEKPSGSEQTPIITRTSFPLSSWINLVFSLGCFPRKRFGLRPVSPHLGDKAFLIGSVTSLMTVSWLPPKVMKGLWTSSPSSLTRRSPSAQRRLPLSTISSQFAYQVAQAGQWRRCFVMNLTRSLRIVFGAPAPLASAPHVSLCTRFLPLMALALGTAPPVLVVPGERCCLVASS